MADEQGECSGTKNSNNPSRHKNLSLQEVLDAVLDSSEELSDNDSENCGDSSLDEDTHSDSDDEIPVQNDAREACDRDIDLLVDVSYYSFGYTYSVFSISTMF